MTFDLIDDVLEQSDDRILVLKQVSRAEEYLGDHFPGFPVLPGVMMLEVMAQAARRLIGGRTAEPVVLGEARVVKFGMMVRPGRALEVEVSVGDEQPDGSFACRGVGRVRAAAVASVGAGDVDETAVSGRFTMRRLRADTDARADENHQG